MNSCQSVAFTNISNKTLQKEREIEETRIMNHLFLDTKIQNRKPVSCCFFLKLFVR